MGWDILIIWECEFGNPKIVAGKIDAFLSSNKSA
jgi:G:T-mismatch repair DNA endonuclease (very short patch repair protein)